ncbi:MAG: hypothetical protein J0H34_23840 [Rhizobiales bacterium]|jgi:hypothetical protein|nr:hypothetical protein [Hyphomicrobiales bacterium]
MLDFGKIREKEKGLLQRKAKLEADLARLRTQEKKAARRDDTRRKIVLGGVVLAAVEAGNVAPDFVAGLVRAHVAERDKKLFVGTAFAVPEATDSGAAESDMRE